jgi:hypothetical protein
MIKLKLMIIALLASPFLFGCAQKSILSQKDYFFLENPELSSRYQEFGVTSFESRDYYRGKEFTTISTIFRVLKNKFAENKDVLEEINHIEEIYLDDYTNEPKNIRGLTPEELLPGDEIYFFKYREKRKIEYGIIVLNGGQIRKRIVDQVTEGDPKLLDAFGESRKREELTNFMAMKKGTGINK